MRTQTNTTTAGKTAKAGIEPAVAGSELDVKSMTTREVVDALFRLCHSYTGEFSAIRKDVSVLKRDVGILKEDVNALKEDVKVLKEDVNELKGVLKERMGQLEGNVERILELVQR